MCNMQRYPWVFAMYQELRFLREISRHDFEGAGFAKARAKLEKLMEATDREMANENRPCFQCDIEAAEERLATVRKELDAALEDAEDAKLDAKWAQDAVVKALRGTPFVTTHDAVAAWKQAMEDNATLQRVLFENATVMDDDGKRLVVIIAKPNRTKEKPDGGHD